MTPERLDRERRLKAARAQLRSDGAPPPEGGPTGRSVTFTADIPAPAAKPAPFGGLALVILEEL